MTRSEWARECMCLRSRISDLKRCLANERSTALKERLDALEAEMDEAEHELNELYLWDDIGR